MEQQSKTYQESKAVDSKKITDPEKLKKQIKFSGTLSIAVGLIFIVLGILMTIILKYNMSATIAGAIIGLIYIILGVLIRKNPATARKPLYIALAFSVLIMVLGFLGGSNPGLLLILYVAIIASSLKYIKRLENLQPTS